VLEKHRFGWIQDEIRRGQFEESIVLFGRMIKADSQDAMALYGRGEAHRLRAGKDDANAALADLNAAVALETPQSKPIPESWRSLGLVHKQSNNASAAASAFEKYLAMAPEAADANLIKHYLTELKP
jgi:beta-barrel assembly-enhancing protease